MPSYSGRSMSYFCAMPGVTNLAEVKLSAREHRRRRGVDEGLEGAHRPPTKCLPLKNLTRDFGAVRLTRTAGLKPLPMPDAGGPVSISHDDGASTAVTGSLVSSMARMTAGNGSRTSPEKLKPVAGSQDAIRRVVEGSVEWTHRRLHLRRDPSLSGQRRSRPRRSLRDPRVVSPVAKKMMSVWDRNSTDSRTSLDGRRAAHDVPLHDPTSTLR